MVSPGAEAQSGLNAWPLDIVAFYPEYLNPSNPHPVYFLRIGHWTLDVVRLEHNMVSIAHIDDHVLAVCGNTRHPSQEIFAGYGSAEVSQSVLELLSHCLAQFELCLGLILTGGAKR
jgi:hypothetical protein